LDRYLVKYALADSYQNFLQAGEPYPFVQKRELKPRARVIEKEYANQNHFLVIFCEGTIPAAYKKYIRFFDSNKVTKETIDEIAYVKLSRQYVRNLRYFDNVGFERLILDLLPVDYALLIQQDQTIRKRNRYVLSHFHVRIDWPIDDAVEDLAQQLRYISKDIYERGEKYAQWLRYKLFEKYGFYHMIGGRRTAAVVAAQLLKRMEFISTVYVGSSETRSLTRFSERGVFKYVLVKLPLAEISQLAEENKVREKCFKERFLLDLKEDYGVGILQVVYRDTANAKPPLDGKLRKLKPDYQWLTISDQLLMPLHDYLDIYPVSYKTIYASDL